MQINDPQYNYCDEQMNEHTTVTSIPTLNSKRQYPLTSRSYLQEIQTTNSTQRQKQSHNQNKIEKYIEKRDKKIQQIKEELQNKRMNQCTFKPQTNISQKKRNLNQFLESQDQHLQKIETKRNKLKKELEEKNQQPFKPKINNKEKNNSKPAHERLYHCKEFQKENACQFVPQIQKKSKKMARNIPVDELLYNDAIRRTGKKKDAVINDKNVTTKNNNTEKFVAQKFIKQFYYVLEDLDLVKCRVYDFDEFKCILRKLGFLSFGQESDSDLAEQERILADEAYFLIEEYGVNARNTSILLMAFIGIFNVNPINFTEEVYEGHTNFDISQTDGRKVQRHFDLLFRNKLSNDIKSKKNHEAKPEDYSYHPETNGQSAELAEKYRCKMIAKANKRFEENNLNIFVSDNKELTHEDLLVIDSLGKNLQISQLKEKKERQIEKECTFHPKINNQKKEADGKTGMEKSRQLYQYARTRQDKQKTEHNFERNGQKEKTVHSPNIKSHEKTKSYKKVNEIKDIEKNIARMYEGRKIREERNQYLARGYKKQENSKKQANNNKKDEERQPFIVVDVNMDQEVYQIEFYKGDEGKIDEIVNDFCQEHFLDEECKRQLFEMVEKQIETFFEEYGKERNS